MLKNEIKSRWSVKMCNDEKWTYISFKMPISTDIENASIYASLQLKTKFSTWCWKTRAKSLVLSYIRVTKITFYTEIFTWKLVCVSFYSCTKTANHFSCQNLRVEKMYIDIIIYFQFHFWWWSHNTLQLSQMNTRSTHHFRYGYMTQRLQKIKFQLFFFKYY